MDDDAFLSEFLIAGPVFVLAPFPRHADNEETLRALVRGNSEGKDGSVKRHVVVFTDPDLAERFLSTFNFPNHRPLSFPSKRDFGAALIHLAAMGETHVGFDPGETNVRVIDIPRIVEGIANRPR